LKGNSLYFISVVKRQVIRAAQGARLFELTTIRLQKHNQTFLKGTIGNAVMYGRIKYKPTLLKVLPVFQIAWTQGPHHPA